MNARSSDIWRTAEQVRRRNRVRAAAWWIGFVAASGVVLYALLLWGALENGLAG